MSRQNKSRPAPFTALIACANVATVTNLRNYTNNKSKWNKRFLLFLVEQKVSRGKLSFLHTLFLENEGQIDQSNYGTMPFMSKQVSLWKISSILQKMKIGQKPIYALLARRPSNRILQCLSFPKTYDNRKRPKGSLKTLCLRLSFWTNLAAVAGKYEHWIRFVVHHIGFR